MAVSASEVESVLRFLRTNGLADTDTALREEMAGKFSEADLGCSDYEKFVFPMIPPVRIPAIPRSGDVSVACEGSFGSTAVSSSEDEFVSLGSSTSDICSSDFTNPYGIKLTGPGYLECSSDDMSQFDTARDYHDFDMQNNLFWYDEKDGGNFMTPSFEGAEFLGCPTEDKFIMTLDLLHNQSDLSHNPSELLSPDFLDKTCDFSTVATNLEPGSDYHHFGQRNKVEEEEKEYNYLSVKRTSLENFDVGDSNTNNWWNESFEVSEKDSVLKGIDTTFELRDRDTKEEEIVNWPEDGVNKDGDDEADNEVSLYSACEDEYEVFELRIVHRKNRTGFEASKDFEIVTNTVIAGRYYVTEYIGSAAFSKVVQAHDLHTGVNVCLKIIKNDKEFFDQSLDEIKLLKLVNKHDPADERHILRLYDYFYYQEHLFIVCELLRANLYEFQQFNQESGGEAYFTLRRLQIVTRQCLEALEFLHRLGILHCDLKPENILIKSYSRCEIKVIDLGSSCFASDNLCMYVQSRSYRAPEVILGLPYDQKIDMWSLGCVLAELCSGEVLFPNEGVVTILSRMIGMFGPIDVDMLERGQETSKYFTEDFDLYHMNEETDQMEHIIPEETSIEGHLGVNDTGFINFIRSLLEMNPKNRLTAKEALQHPWLSHIYWSNPR